MATYDVILVGGGLSNALNAWRLKQVRPDVRLLVLEAGERLGGNHTWSFHSSDVSPEALAWLQPLICRSWPEQEVRFPGHARVLPTGYHSITSDRLHEVIAPALGPSVRYNVRAASLRADGVVLDTQETIAGRCVFDGRGFPRDANVALGYQKFLGLEVRTAAPHGLTRPVIMDARVEQFDGYRFVYCLPFSPTEMLIEDTYYSDKPDLDLPLLRRRVDDYAAANGYRIASVVREESGVLPIVLAGDSGAFWPEGQEVASAGLRAGLFHPTTSYSLPDAVRMADIVTGIDRFETAPVAAQLGQMARDQWASRGFFRFLNRMFFVGALQGERRDIMERFYLLPPDLIERFYAGQISAADKARIMWIMLQKPPLSIFRAANASAATAAWQFADRNRASSASGRAMGR